MSIVLAITAWDAQIWRERVQQALPDTRVYLLGEDYLPEDVRHVLCWKHPHGALAAFTNLLSVHSLGAGVDHMMSDPQLPPDVPLFRVIDTSLTAQMVQWVCLQVLAHHRRLPLYLEQQRAHVWKDHRENLSAGKVRVGILGFGELGQNAGHALKMLGYDVAGWRRTTAGAQDLPVFHGESGLKELLGRTNILVSLLPLTPDTKGILNKMLFVQLDHGSAFGAPVIINAGRGGLQVEKDIVAALEDGTLGGASLDVFEEEPLSATSPLWDHPRVIITPHNAAVSVPEDVTAFVIQQIKDIEIGASPWGKVNPEAGY